MAKVLLVEDDNNLREIYQARLQAEGYDIASARDGEEALVVAKQELPDLVISDVMMPKISGFEMLDILRNTEGLQRVKVIMLTALGQSEDQTRADSLGADRYLVKSQVTLEDIVNAAHDLLAEAGAIEADPTPEPAAAAPVAATVAAEQIASAPLAVEPAPAPEPMPVASAPEIAPDPVVTPEPVAMPSEPVQAPAQVIPVASAPPEMPEDIDTASVSMPPTPMSTMPAEEDQTAAPQQFAMPSEPVAIPTPAVASEPVSAPSEPLATADPVAMPVDQPVAVPEPSIREAIDPVQQPAVAPFEPLASVTPSDDQPLSSQQEAADVEAQIEQFIDSQNGQPEPEAEVAPMSNTTTPTATPEQEATLRQAVDTLSGVTQAPAQQPQPENPAQTTPAEPAQPVPETESPSATHGKTIQPLDTPSDNARSLEELVAAEEAKEQGQPQPGQTLATPAQPPAPAVKPPAAANDFDPNSIAL